jgi:hypothetical protein
MGYLKRGLMYLWQLPQNLLGMFFLMIYSILGNKNFIDFDVWSVRVPGLNFTADGNFFVFNNNKKRLYGYSLGCYVFVSYDREYMEFHYKEEEIDDKVNEVIVHETGHCIQSVFLGWLYLIVIALPSLIVTGISPGLAKRLYTETWAERLTTNKGLQPLAREGE